jgi:tRNA pseudouridine32 synthase/23S rRNA pseudouridine746 synthase
VTNNTVEKTPFIVPHCEQDVTILWQDESLLIVNKPSGLLSVPGKHPDNKDCLITRVQQDFPTALIVHRLDMDTSGVMVVALNPDCHKALNKLFAERKVIKQYHATVFGLLQEQVQLIDLPLICDWPNRPKQKVDFEHGKAAQTTVELLRTDTEKNQSHVLLKPITGRSHQLRVHLAEIDHPILGCDFYAHEQARAMSDRLLLHASQLIFEHPVTGEEIIGDCPAPF